MAYTGRRLIGRGEGWDGGERGEIRERDFGQHGIGRAATTVQEVGVR